MGWIVAAALTCAIVLVLLALGAPVLARWRAADRDFRQARGTLHCREIERALPPLVRLVGERRAELTRLDAALRDDAIAEQQEFDRTLAEYLVDTRLDEVPGVGATRVAAVKSGAFRRSLRDLLTADTVPGIGPQTAAAIATWVGQMEREWPSLRSGEFPGKRRIASEHAMHRATLAATRATVETTLSQLEQIQQLAQAERDRLRRVGPGAFRAALASPDAASAEVQTYVLGAFPPWGRPPAWFVELLAIERTTATGAE
jgi:hypothetical protein